MRAMWFCLVVSLSVSSLCLQHSCFCTASCSVFIREEKKAKKLNKNERNCEFLRHRPHSMGEKHRKRASGGESMREENRAVNGSWGEIKRALCLFFPTYWWLATRPEYQQKQEYLIGYVLYNERSRDRGRVKKQGDSHPPGTIFQDPDWDDRTYRRATGMLGLIYSL